MQHTFQDLLLDEILQAVLAAPCVPAASFLQGLSVTSLHPLSTRECTSVQHIFLAVLLDAVLQAVLAAPCVTAASFLQGSFSYKSAPTHLKAMHLCAPHPPGCAAWCSPAEAMVA